MLYHDSTMQTWDENYVSFLPIHAMLNDILRTHLQTLFPSITAFSVLLLHVSQLEHPQISPETTTIHKRRRYHPNASILEQVMVNVRRAIRNEDLVYIDRGRGAAIIFPDVDFQGASKIIERVYHSVNLLQAETLIPPLTHETEIVLGIGSYPESGAALEQVLASAGRVLYRLTLRPAITPHLWDNMPSVTSTPSTEANDAVQAKNAISQDEDTWTSTAHTSDLEPEGSLAHDFKSIPYLQLPAVLPSRLKKLVAYDIAVRYRCVPVGRDHQQLTIAMADPTDRDTVSVLHKITHMTIFPVSCDIKALDILLETQW